MTRSFFLSLAAVTVLAEILVARPFDPEAWRKDLLNFPCTNSASARPILSLVRQDAEQLQRNQSVTKTPLTLGQRTFKDGLGTHANSHIRILSPEPITRFRAWVGVDNNPRAGAGSVFFTVKSEGRELFRSGVMRWGGAPAKIDLALDASSSGPVLALDLEAGDAGDGIMCDHADWAEAAITLKSGTTLRLAGLPQDSLPRPQGSYPFSFTFGGQTSDYWFDDEVEQAKLWSLSQYLPNNLLTVPLARLDAYSFHSAMASSLIPGWIADAPEFDRATAEKLLQRYREVRHLLVGAWYPLLPYSRSPKDWIASQFHRPDLN